MKVFIYPTYDPKRDKSGNLYIDHFRKAFEADSHWEVLNRCPRSETLGLLLNLRAELFILHWVDLIPSKPLGRLQTFFFKLGVLAARRRSARIVWLLHNKGAHDDGSSRPARLMDWMAAKADMVLTHSEEGCRFFRQRYPSSVAPCHYIPHPVYTSRIFAPAPVPEWDYIIWGGISRRKRVLEFVRFAAGCKALADKKILICGACRDAELDAQIRSALSPFIDYENAFLSDAQLAERIAASRCVLFTYDGGTVLSSGALIYSLNFLKPIIGPAVGSFADLSDIVSCYENFDEIPSLPLRDISAAALRYIESNSWEDFPVKVLSASGHFTFV